MNTVDLPGTRRSWRRLLGPALLVVGSLHVGYGLVIAADPLARLSAAGVVGAAPTDPVAETWFWFMVAGVPMLLAGHLVSWAHRRTGRVPRFVAPYLAVLGASALLYPVSGLWLYLPLAAAAAVAGRAPTTMDVAAE